MELVIEKRDHRKSAGTGTVVVIVGSPVDRRVYRAVVGEEGECWRSLVLEGIVDLPEHSSAEEDTARHSPAGRMAAEDILLVDYRRSNRCLTLCGVALDK